MRSSLETLEAAVHKGDRALALILVFALHVAGLWLLWIDNWMPQLRGPTEIVSAMIIVPTGGDSRRRKFRRDSLRIPAPARIAPAIVPFVSSPPAVVCNPDPAQSSVDWSEEARAAAAVAAQHTAPIEPQIKSKAPSV